jgi:hypothetical protein
MNRFLTLPTYFSFIISAILLTGCSSGSDGSGSTIPANAIVIDETNAEQVVLSAASVADTFNDSLNNLALGVETTPVIGLKTALNIVLPLIKNRSNNDGIDLATGATYSDSGACSGGGTFSVSGNETEDGVNPYTESGSATFVNCSESGFTIHGSLTFSASQDSSTGDYTDNVSGSLSMTVSGQDDTVTLKMTRIDFKETGNNYTGTFTTNALTFTIDFVSNGKGSGGFSVTLLKPIVENNASGCPESGHIQVTGANNTTAEGIFNGDDTTMTIKANGSVVNPSAACI